jgi:serine 3-dehydrogenase
MSRIAGKLAFVTGASSGIGAACARRFAAQGARLVLWARRVDRLEKLAAELRQQHQVPVSVAQVDVRDRAAVFEAAGRLVGDGGRGTGEGVPDILLNNAGLASGLSKLQEGDFEDWDKMIDTNIKGVLNVSRALLPHMVARGTGHVVNIGSTAGHMVYPGGNVYNATKYALRALNEGMNLDVAGTAIRVSSVDPGFVETEFSEVRFHGDKAQAKAVYRGFTPLSADDVADAICFVVNLPPHVNVLDLVMMPTAQRNIYVVDRAPER